MLEVKPDATRLFLPLPVRSFAFRSRLDDRRMVGEKSCLQTEQLLRMFCDGDL